MIDVSEYQGAVDWQRVKASGVDRAMVKLGEDRDGVLGPRIDRYAVTNLHHARAAGVHVGVYWFAHPGHNTPAASAAAFLSMAHGHLLPGDIPPALDLELEEGLSLTQLDWWKGTWFRDVDQVIGTLAMFYSFRYFLNAFHLLPHRPVWGAHPGNITDTERARWSFWQYSSSGRVPGVVGTVDLDETLHPDNVPVLPAVTA